MEKSYIGEPCATRMSGAQVVRDKLERVYSMTKQVEELLRNRLDNFAVPQPARPETNAKVPSPSMSPYFEGLHSDLCSCERTLENTMEFIRSLDM